LTFRSGRAAQEVDRQGWPAPPGVTDAFNRHDLDAIMAAFSDDCVFESPRGADPWGKRFVGKDDGPTGDSVARSEGSVSDRSAGSELIAGGGASDRSPNQPAPTQRERRRFFSKGPRSSLSSDLLRSGSYSPDVGMDAPLRHASRMALIPVRVAAMRATVSLKNLRGA
jgi:hypothetical protein